MFEFCFFIMVKKDYWQKAQAAVLDVLFKLTKKESMDTYFNAPRLALSFIEPDPYFGTIADTEFDKLLEPFVNAGWVLRVKVKGINKRWSSIGFRANLSSEVEMKKFVSKVL